MLCLLEIEEQGSGRGYPKWESVYGKAFQGIHSKLFPELFHGIVIDKGPFIHGRNVPRVAKFFLYTLLPSPLNEDFLRGECPQKS